jgi:hypothetical protein
MLSTIATYQMISGNLTRSLETTSKQPQIAREAEYYLSKIGKVKNIDDFLADRRVFSFAMRAYGLTDMIDAKAFMRKVLTEGVDEPQAFANKLADGRYREFAAAFNFKRYGEATTVFERTRQGTVDRFVRLSLESQVGETSEGARLALYFQRKAPEITSVYRILADRNLITVVQTALGLDPSTSLMPLERQAQLIESKLDIKSLSDPKELQKFMTRFGTMYDLNNGVGMNPIPQLLGATPSAGISMNLLQSIQRLRLGG